MKELSYLRDQLLKKDSGNKLLLAGVSMFIIAITLAPLASYPIGTKAYAQNASKSSDIPGNVVNSIYLSITNHRYRQGEFGSDTITGTIVNNSTQNIILPGVYAALYNKDNKLITMELGTASIPSLRAGDDSPFTITMV